ncbi:MAG TPA: hypothetical protein VF521_11235, partial [Pyrinomonadaceae bacterium]
MRRKIQTSPLAYLAAVAAVAAALVCPCATRVGAQSLTGKQKVSADLRQKLSTATGKVNVVIKAASAWNRTLDDAVKS